MVDNIGHPDEAAFRPRQQRLEYEEAVSTI